MSSSRSTNPRKFAEKIAKLHQKEVEQTMAFEQIMAEVIIATRGTTSSANQGQQGVIKGGGAAGNTNTVNNMPPTTSHHLHVNQSSITSRAESLPNVNHMSVGSSGHQSSGIDLQSALSNLEEMKSGKGGSGGHRERRHTTSIHSGGPGHLNPSHRGHEPRSITHSSERVRRPSPSSPYSTPYLSPPDTWRRTNSDSALHQSSSMMSYDGSGGGNVIDGAIGEIGSGYPGVGAQGFIHVKQEQAHHNQCQGQHQPLQHQQPLLNNQRSSPIYMASSSLTNITSVGASSGEGRSVDSGPQSTPQSAGSSWGEQHQPIQQVQHNLHHLQQLSLNQGNLLLTNSGGGGRPKSCDVPGITIYPSPHHQQDGHFHHDPNRLHLHHIPPSANTGSLPDLTNFRFPPPPLIPLIPLDGDGDSSGTGTPSAILNSGRGTAGGGGTGGGGTPVGVSNPLSDTQSSFHYHQVVSNGNGVPTPVSTPITYSSSTTQHRQQQPPSPYSVNSNSPFSPPSPLSSNLGFSPPGGECHCPGGGEPHHHQQGTNHSIPDIILTEPGTHGDGGLLRQNSTGYDATSNDMLFNSDSFKNDPLEIDLIDFDGLNILTDMPDPDGENVPITH